MYVNHALAFALLKFLEKLFKGDPNFELEYDTAFNKLLEKGYILKCNVDNNIKNFVPHQGVLHPLKDTIRIVNDCAAKYKGKCLNDSLVTGGRLINRVSKVLLRWRKGQYTFIADIEGMYMQIHTAPEDTQFSGMLYLEPGKEKIDKNIKKYKMNRHIFGAKDSPFVAIAALRLILQKNFSKEISKKAIECFYVDVFITSDDNPEKLLEFGLSVTNGLKPYFNLCKHYTKPQLLEEQVEPPKRY